MLFKPKPTSKSRTYCKKCKDFNKENTYSFKYNQQKRKKLK